MRNNWRANLIPAAAVIPAPIAYIKIIMIKKLVIKPRPRTRRSALPHTLARPGLLLRESQTLCWAYAEPGPLL